MVRGDGKRPCGALRTTAARGFDVRARGEYDRCDAPSGEVRGADTDDRGEQGSISARSFGRRREEGGCGGEQSWSCARSDPRWARSLVRAFLPLEPQEWQAGGKEKGRDTPRSGRAAEAENVALVFLQGSSCPRIAEHARGRRFAAVAC